ncbi:MAG: AsmA-like C-terminal region-containing protein [Bacteroidota bacterium]|nr:AsmA-like C-terminal region-containing protein [Bacteroidota bacterium]
MPKWVKAVLISFVFVIIILTSAVLYVYYNLDQLKQLALKEVNKQLSATLRAKSIDVTFWNTFPNVSLAFNEISIDDPIRKNKKLLKAQHLYLGFNFYDIINEKYQIQLLELDSGTLHLFVDATNQANYLIIKESVQDSARKKSPFSFKLNKLKFNKVHLVYHNIIQEFNIETAVENAQLSGSFSDEIFELTLSLDAWLKTFESGGTELFKEKHIQLSTALLVDRKKDLYTIAKSECSIDALELELAGKVKQLNKKTDFDIQFSANQISIQNLLSILPFKLPESINNYASEGNVFFKGTLKGLKSIKEFPLIRLNFGIENGTLTDPESKLKLEQISFKGEYSNGSKKSLSGSVLNLSKIEASLQNQKLYGKLQLQDFEHPKLILDFNGNTDLAVLTRFLKIPEIQETTGELQFSCSVKGEQKNNTWDWSDAYNAGLFKANITHLKMRDFEKPITNCSIESRFTNNILSFDKVSLTAGKTKLQASGSIHKILDYVFGKQQKLTAEMIIESDLVGLEDLLIYSPPKVTATDENKLDYRISVEMHLLQLKYKKFIAKELKAKLWIEPAYIEFEKVQMQTNGGNITAKATLLIDEKSYTLKSNVSSKNLNINEVLSEFDNFGQGELTYKNLFGTLSAETDMVLVWDEKFNPLTEKLQMVSDISIKNGQLLNYEPLNSLSRFVDVNELNNLKFSDFKNVITVKNKVLHIPAMELKNNALNLNLSGTHTFDNYMDYNVKLSLSELLSKKRKPQPNEFGEEDEITNTMNLFITVKGQADNLKFAYDKRAVKTKINQDIKTEKETIKELFRKEFGIKKDSTLKKTEKKNEKNDEIEFEPN